MSEFYSNLKPAERKALRAEMLRMTIQGMTDSNPKASKGAIRVKAAKFVDAATVKEMTASSPYSINPCTEPECAALCETDPENCTCNTRCIHQQENEAI